MSVFGEVQSLYKNGKEFSKDKYAINKLADILRNISAIIILFLLLLQYWDFIDDYSIIKIPLFGDRLRDVLHKHSFVLFIVWIIFDTLSTPFFSKIVVLIESECKVKLLPLWNTIEDLFEISIASLMVLFSANSFIEFYNGYNVLTIENQKVYGLIILYIFFGIINWVYIKNSNRWYYIEKRYTDYFDMSGNRIAEDDKVIYYGKIYKIIYAREDEVMNSKLWLVEDTIRIIDKVILLEDAVKDEKGKIKVYEYGMGEKGRK